MNITRIEVWRKIADIEKERGGLLNRRAIKHLNELNNQIDYAISDQIKFLLSLTREGKENAESRQSNRN